MNSRVASFSGSVTFNLKLNVEGLVGFRSLDFQVQGSRLSVQVDCLQQNAQHTPHIPSC